MARSATPRFLILLFLFVLLDYPGRSAPLEVVSPESVGVSSERLSRLDQVVEKAIEDEEIPGAVLLVARQGKVIYREAFGDRAVEPEVEPMEVGSIFDMASLTKVMATATSMMILVEEGRLSLYDEVAEYIPEFGRRGKDKITLLQLLTHYSGLRPDLDLDVEWEGYETAIDLANRERLVEEPGTTFIYSDINYFVLAEVVRQVTGKKIDEFAEERIFRPLGMMDTGFNPPEKKLSRVVPTEKRDGELIRGKVHDPTAFRMDGVAGHAGLFSTVDDSAVWAQMILSGGAYGDTRILSPLSVLKMSTPQSPVGIEDWRGLGFDIETRFSTNRGDLFPVGSFGHTGFTGTSIWVDPYTETLVLLFTSRLHPDGEGNVVGLRRRIASVVGGAVVDLALDRELFYLRY